MRSADSRSRRWAGVDLRPGCYASFAMSAGRHSRRASVAGMPIQWASPPCSRWHRDPHLGGSSRRMAVPRLTSRTVTAGPGCGARDPPICMVGLLSAPHARGAQNWDYVARNIIPPHQRRRQVPVGDDQIPVILLPGEPLGLAFPAAVRPAAGNTGAGGRRAGRTPRRRFWPARRPRRTRTTTRAAPWVSPGDPKRGADAGWTRTTITARQPRVRVQVRHSRLARGSPRRASLRAIGSA